MSATLSVLTLVKNRNLHLARLIEGLAQSTVAPDELIVVDMTGQWVAPRAAFPIRVIGMTTEGLPLAAARNAAARAAASKTLLFLDVDCIPTRQLAGAVMEHLAANGGIVCAEVRYLAAGESDAGWNEAALWSVARRHPVRSFPIRGCRLESNPGLLWSLCFAVDRSLFFDLGGFDEAFSGYGAEDTDFGFRAHAAGVQLFFLGGVGALHQHHPIFDPPLQHFDDIVRNAQLFHRKWNVWAMAGWLDQFKARGLITVSNDSITTVRRPTPDETAAARVDRPF